MSLVYHHITVVEIVDVATAYCHCRLDKRLKGNSTSCLVKVDFFTINDVRQLLLLVFIPGVIGFNALFKSMVSYCYYPCRNAVYFKYTFSILGMYFPKKESTVEVYFIVT